MDSKNQPVRNTSGPVLNAQISTPKVAKSNREESGPITAAKRMISCWRQCCGLAMSMGRTESKGMPISDRS